MFTFCMVNIALFFAVIVCLFVHLKNSVRDGKRKKKFHTKKTNRKHITCLLYKQNRFSATIFYLIFETRKTKI